MTNKKLSRLLEPNLKLYFLCMVVFAIATAWVDVLLGLVQLCAIAGLYVYFTRSGKKRRQGILQYIDNLTGSVDTASKSTLINSPLPHYGVPPRYRRSHLEQRELPPAGRCPGSICLK